MAQLEELHFVYSFSDIISFNDKHNDFESEDLVHLQNLKKLKVLTLMVARVRNSQHWIDDKHVRGGFKGFDVLVTKILPIFPSLKNLGIFGKVPMNWQMKHREIEIDFCSFDYFDYMADF
ncbi:hypothetical protein ACHAXN_004165 [Cyclotella atomus]